MIVFILSLFLDAECAWWPQKPPPGTGTGAVLIVDDSTKP